MPAHKITGNVKNRFWIFPLFLILGIGHWATAQKELHPELQKLAKPGSKASFMDFKEPVSLGPAAFLNNYKAALGLGSEDEVRIVKAESDGLGFTHHSTQQYYGDIPVEFAELKIHEKGGKIQVVNGRVISDISVNTTPAVSEATALSKSLEHVGAEKYAWEADYLEQLIKEKRNDPNATLYPKGQLVITSPLGVADSDGKNYILAWKFEIYDALLNNAQMVYVDAHVGKVVNSFPLTHTNCTPGTATTNFYGTRTIHADMPAGSPFYILDANCAGTSNVRIHTRSMASGTPTEFEDADNVWDNKQQQSAVTSHWGMEVSLGYFNSVHARNSYDNNGGAINIHNDVTFFRSSGEPHGRNAAFTPAIGLMEIGWGNNQSANTPGDDINSLDVVGHELAHGVTWTSAGLVYQGESGALNESFSDIFGTHIEFWAIGGDWLIGGDLVIPHFRNMANPNKEQDPDTYNDPYFWKSTVGTTIDTDYGGVHSNSGVQNKWFHLLSVGGSDKNSNGDKYNVKGIGISKAARIAYRNLTLYLNSTSKYIDARDGAIQAAEDLFGECSEEVISTTNAWYAVGVGDPALMIDSIAVEATACDTNSGKAFIMVKGLAGTAQYQWDDPMMQTTQQAVGLAKGMYSVTVSDSGNNCMVDTTLEVTEAANFTIKVRTIGASDCGADNGAATLQITGITGTPDINWSTGDSIHFISGLEPGMYGVTVTDTSTTCTLDTLFEIGERKVKVIIAGGGGRTFCQSDNDREIILHAVADSCFGCTYTWSTGATSESINVISGGTYTVTAMDTSGCSGVASTDVMIWERDCDDCYVNDFWKFFGFGDCSEWQIPRLHAVDPNAIAGPLGYGESQWVSVNDNLGFTIYFENDPAFATAPAQVVDIRLPIDPQLDIFSLRLGNYGFGFFTFEVPPNTTFYSQRLDVRDSLGVYVDVTAGIDVVNQEAFWIFESIDPATGLPPDDALTGFLPVNDTTINIYNDTLPKAGEGFVSFAIRPNPADVTGDSITAQASIVFDINAPLPTNTWVNLVDAVPPVSALSPLPANSDTTLILLEWSGVDDTTAVGVSHYELYVSRDGAPFDLYQSNIDTTAYTFSGFEGSDYAFFVRAVDNVGNREPLKGVGEDTISINKGLLVAPILYLQGAYDATAGLMRDDLRLTGILPLDEPFTALGYTHVGGGEESTTQAVFDVATADAIVDWVLLELRDQADSTVVVATRSALLQRDGDVVDVDGVSPVSFAGAAEGEYYLVLRHRNHLGVMSAAPVDLSKTATVVDFTASISQAFGGANGVGALGDGNLGLYSGDFNRNGQVQNTDFAAMVLTLGTAGYLQGDLDLNGQVQNTDVQFKLLPNLGKGQQFPE